MRTGSLALILSVVCLSLLRTSQAAFEDEFAGKVAFISGGTSGIGFATAMRLASMGTKVAIIGRNEERGKAAEAAINGNATVAEHGGRAKFYQCDVTQHIKVKSTIAAVVNDLGGLHYAVNSAGIGGFLGRFDEMPDSLLWGVNDPVMNNLYGVIHCVLEEVRYWRSHNQDAAIVNLSSYNGIRATAYGTMYGASKHGINGVTQSVAIENVENPRIRVNSVCPGLVDTPLTWNQAKWFLRGEQPWQGHYIDSAQDPDWVANRPEWVKELIGQKILSPYEEAEAIIFLLSSRASGITGMIYPVDNGASAK
ncbi:putative oxidoreductase; short chain dehydrogenase/reductase family protein [Paratrimastix pyriformis]|uniref:Oxidoreductase n=1 Tax=Paratrimastix pyriformis TaxID=342808 RepID=A0ABQ8U529_9EUKA|nr:putative oxidoreductase; short chain dehydrogenase/reductase family protein [Paratrimastix pyriformis]